MVRSERSIGEKPLQGAVSLPAEQPASGRLSLRGLPPTLTVQRAGELLGISRYAAYRAAANGELPVLRLGRRLLVPTPRLLAMLGVDSTPDESMVEAS